MTHNQSGLTPLISEVLADPDRAHSDVFRRMLQAGLQARSTLKRRRGSGPAVTSAPPERTTRRNGTGISRSTVPRICAEIDEAVHDFLHRRIDHTWFPHLVLGATYLDVRHRGRVVSEALVVATSVSSDGRREILGMALGDAQTTDFWTEFLRDLPDRRLKVASDADPLGVTLVTPDAHAGLKAAVKAILPGAGWQRCRDHFARTATQKIGSAPSKPVNAPISTTFAQTTSETVLAQYKAVTDSLRSPFPQIAAMLETAEPDRTGFAPSPCEHWQKVWSNNPIERLNREIKRRADVVQIFPDRDSVTRLIAALLQEQHEEWSYGERRYLSDTSTRTLTHTLHDHALQAHQTALKAA
ncbi:Transposase, Mutator family [Propionibacterium cyclohexanicum]|uniref:Mutator family transposase n=1 Tax=Propionibacterium cyclohexanicum TaxID=64702 RepID=A0A1H9RVG8_9ACTN|nr:Transposase, Mutator family [Propionibacterium cyclohexanicum]